MRTQDTQEGHVTPFFESPQQVDGKPQVVIYNARWEDVWPTLGLQPKDVDLCWADPPYGVKERTKRNSAGRGIGEKRIHASRRARDWSELVGDDRKFDPMPLLEFPRLVTWGANHYARQLPLSSSWWWDKREGTTPDDNADGELAWTNLGGPARQFSHLWRGLCQASEKMGGGERIHPTQKPVALCEWGFQRAGLKPGQLVFAPYLGSGPEVRAAINMGLRIIGCEVDADYCRTVVAHRVALAAPRRGQEGQVLLPL